MSARLQAKCAGSISSSVRPEAASVSLSSVTVATIVPTSATKPDVVCCLLSSNMPPPHFQASCCVLQRRGVVRPTSAVRAVNASTRTSVAMGDVSAPTDPTNPDVVSHFRLQTFA